MKKISIALSVIFFFLLLKAGYALPSIVCDKDVYVALQKFDAFCNISNDLSYGITVHNYTLLFPISGVIFEPFVKKNVTYNASVPIYEPCLQNFTVNGSWIYNETDGLYYFNGYALNCTNIYSINQTNDTCEYETQCYAGNTEEERWKWDFVPLELPFNMNASETKEFLFKVSVPIGSSGKFNVTATIFYNSENITASLDPWWNSAWLMRRNITINNTANSNTLADYQIPINLTYDSDIQPDFSDIRFTWYNSTDESEAEIPYWIESKVNSAWAYVWVKVPSIPANSYATIYVYYKNSTPVNSASNGKNVFIWFNFDGNGTFDYEINELNSPVDAFANDSNSVKHTAITSNRYEYGAFNGSYANVSIRAKINLGTLQSIENAGLMPQWTYTGTNHNNWAGCQVEYSTGYPNYSRWAIMNPNIIAQTNSPAISANTNYTFECTAFSNKTIIFKLDGNEILRGVSTPTIMPAGYGLQAGYALSTTQWFYDILVRKVADPEPSYSVGAEESLNYLTSCSVLYEEGATYYLTQDIIDSGATVCMNITANNVVLDCQGYTIDGVDNIYTRGISSSKINITIRNCLISDWGDGISVSGNNYTIINNILYSDAYGLVLFADSMSIINNTVYSSGTAFAIYSDYNTLINNTAYSNNGGFYFSSSNYNTLINNTAYLNSLSGFSLASYSNYNTLINNTAYSNGEGFYLRLYEGSHYNTLINNIAHFNSVGIKLDISGENNNIINGSIALSSDYDYSLISAGSTNTFTNTNFTESRKINFADSSSWFNYRNESNGIWLKNKVSAGTTITRTLHSWKQTNITWTEQATSTVTAEYNLTGLLPSATYYVQNSSGTYQIPTDSEGNLNFQTQLTTTEQIISVYYLPVYLTVTFNYNSVNFGSLNHNTLNPAPNQESGIYNVSVEASSSYKVEAYGNNFEGPAPLSISNLHLDAAPSPSQLSFSNSVSLSTSLQTIDSNISQSVTVHYHGYWLNIPYKQKKGDYYTTVYIIYSLE